MNYEEYTQNKITNKILINLMKTYLSISKLSTIWSLF